MPPTWSSATRYRPGDGRDGDRRHGQVRSRSSAEETLLTAKIGPTFFASARMLFSMIGLVAKSSSSIMLSFATILVAYDIVPDPMPSWPRFIWITVNG
jgi:hypothetical protein